MSTESLAGSLLSRVKVAKFGKGIHDNVVITKVDIEERKNKGMPIKKMLYITYAIIDPVTKRKKSESEISWWRLDPSSEYFFDNLQQLAIQLHSLLTCYMDEEEAFAAMEPVFEGYKFASVAELQETKWKKSELDVLEGNIQSAFFAAITPFIGVDKTPFRLKVSTDSKGENVAYSSYGPIAERMTVNPSNLKFSESELKNHSKAGNVAVVKTASSALTSL